MGLVWVRGGAALYTNMLWGDSNMAKLRVYWLDRVMLDTRRHEGLKDESDLNRTVDRCWSGMWSNLRSIQKKRPAEMTQRRSSRIDLNTLVRTKEKPVMKRLKISTNCSICVGIGRRESSSALLQNPIYCHRPPCVFLIIFMRAEVTVLIPTIPLRPLHFQMAQKYHSQSSCCWGHRPQ